MTDLDKAWERLLLLPEHVNSVWRCCLWRLSTFIVFRDFPGIISSKLPSINWPSCHQLTLLAGLPLENKRQKIIYKKFGQVFCQIFLGFTSLGKTKNLVYTEIVIRKKYIFVSFRIFRFWKIPQNNVSCQDFIAGNSCELVSY